MSKRRAVPVVFCQEGEHWLAQALGVEVATFGDSLAEAKAAIHEALELYFEDTDEIPNVTSAHVATVVV